MSRFIIVSMPAGARVLEARLDEREPRDTDSVATGCAWLFAAAPTVDDPEAAVRTAVREYFTSPEGQRVREGERLETMGWCDAIPWIPDEVWKRHGLSVFRHPDVERVLLDPEEDLAEELPRQRTATVTAGAAS